VLWLKPKIHAFADEALSDREVNAALTFLVIALVVLPLLPNHPVDPWGIANPTTLWLLFVQIAGVGFAGYIAVRALGPARGLALAGFFAGLVSSTAATFSMSRRAKSEPALAGPLATGIVLANVASAAAQLLIVAVADPALRDAGIVITHHRRRRVGVVRPGPRGGTTRSGRAWATEPAELKPAFAMAAMFALVLSPSAVADHVFGLTACAPAAIVVGHATYAATFAAATLSAAARPWGTKRAGDAHRVHGSTDRQDLDRGVHRRQAARTHRRAAPGRDGRRGDRGVRRALAHASGPAPPKSHGVCNPNAGSAT
jgi:uncharacterized membrane protein (DUF4010 family)